MKRRDLLCVGLTAATSTVFVPRSVFAAGTPLNPFNSPLAGTLFYTADMPGRWSGKQAGHVPQIERSGDAIEVTTGHEMDGFNHYIIKHVILDENFNFVRETMFNPGTDSPVSEHDIAGLKQRVYALSVCNKHDSWLAALDL